MKLKQTCVKLYGNKSKTAGSGASWQMKRKTGAVTKYYLVNTFVDPTHSCFRYTRIIYNKEKIVYHIREAEYLGD